MIKMGLCPKPRDISRRDLSIRSGLERQDRPRSRHGHRRPRLHRGIIVTETE
jgi:hypothetical protein